MVRKKSKKWGWQQSWANLVIGAIVVVILGLLVANMITNKNNGTIDGGAKIDLTQEGQEKNQSEEYKIQANDSLSAISEKFYGDQSFWPILARVNKIDNVNIIFTDSNLEIPQKEKASEIKDQMGTTSYKVVQGDTLFSIAQKMYDDGSQWPLIARANNLGRLPNGNPLVFAESTIKIPR